LIEIQNFKLIQKNKLTSDIFELVFSWEKELKFTCGQFITFLLENIWW
jgi:ferredoxin-NADP reductase